MKTIGKIYILISLIVSFFYYFWGERSYRGYFYNLGMAAVWPVSAFKSYPELDASSELSFANSFIDVLKSGDQEGQYYFYESLGALSFYFHAKSDPSVTLSDFTNIQSSTASFRKFTDALLKDSKITSAVAEELDGMTLGDVVRHHEDYYDDLKDILSSRDENDKKIPHKNIDNSNSANYWRKGWGQGVSEYTYESTDKSLIISCPDHEGAVEAEFQSGEDTYSSANNSKSFDLIIDGEHFQNPFFTDCRVCADNFPYFWNKLLNASSLIVSTGNMNYELNTSGLSETIPPLNSTENSCRVAFY